MASNSWAISDSNGMSHTIRCKTKAFGGWRNFGGYEHLQSEIQQLVYQSGGLFCRFSGANCRVVMIGNKSRLAVNGTYQDDGSQYEPMTSIPAWVWVLVAISVIGGWFFGGLLCLVIGAALSTVYISASLQKNNTKVIIAFVGFR